MKSSEKAFYLFFDWIDDLDHLDAADAWKAIRAIAEYHRSGTNPLDMVDGPLKAVVSIMFHQIKRKEAVSEIRRQAVNTRYTKQENFVVQNSTKPNKVLQEPTTEYSIQNTEYYTLPLRGESNTRTPAHVRENTKPYGTFGNVYLTEEEHADLKERYTDRTDELIENLSRKIKAKGYQYDDHYAAILLWAVQDGITPSSSGHTPKSYDLDEFFEAALKRGMQEFTEVNTNG